MLDYHLTSLCDQIVSCHGQLYCIYYCNRQIARYDSFFDAYELNVFPHEKNRAFKQIFVDNINENAIYALESEIISSCTHCVFRPMKKRSCGKHLSYITK